MDNKMETLKEAFSDELSAFGNGFNTQYALMHLVEKQRNALDQTKSCGTLLVHMFKAFGCILQDLLIAKLQGYDMDEDVLTFVSSYLRNREQCVNIQGYKSEWHYLSKGMPHGSISGPTVFNFFSKLC